jgi:Tfp pilus assembly protein PilN
LNSCCIISWDCDKNVYGLRLKRNGRKLLLEKIYSEQSEQAEEGFIEQLKVIYDKLNCQDCDFIVLTGSVPQSFLLDIDIPDLPLDETKEALEYELQQRLPWSLDELVWHYRKIAERDNSRATVRVYAVPRSEWDKLLDEFQGAEITADSFISPFMTIGEKFSNRNIYLPTIDGDFYYSMVDDIGCRMMRQWSPEKALTEQLSLDELLGETITIAADQRLDEKLMPALLIGEYFLSHKRGHNRAGLALPVGLKPARLKILKTVTLFSSLAALFCLTALLTVNWLHAYSDYEAVAEQIAEVKVQIDALKQRNKKRSKHLKAINNLLKALPENSHLLDILCDLSKKLPHNMWITSYRSSGIKIYITIKSTDESSKIQGVLRSSKLFSLDNFRSRRNLDGSYYIYLQLRTKG